VSLQDFQTYGALIYTLQERYPSIRHSTLVLATIGKTLAQLEGQVTFEHEVVLDVWELIDFEAGRIRSYSYEIYNAGEKIAWYDPFEHPHIPELASTYPHHKHVLPDIKHNRIPALGISFAQPNLPTLIEEILREILPSFPRG
jgi:hypothetical protein